MMPKLRSSLTLMLIFLSMTSWSVGPSTGGGGDAVILPDDSVVLADPFLNSGAPQPDNMPPMRALNPRLLQVADSYLKAASFHLELLAPPGRRIQEGKSPSDIAQVIKVLSLRKNQLRFYAVKDQNELNLFCAVGGRKSYTLPTGAQVEQVACTAGNETFIVEPLFIRMSLKDQALLLVHERLTTLRDEHGGKNYSAIARFTTGLGLYLSIFKEQSKNIYRVLSQQEQKTLTEFYVAIEEIERRDSDITEDSFQWVAAPRGGGRIHTLAKVSHDAIVSLKFVVGKKSEIASGAFLKQGYFNGEIPSLSVNEKAVIENVDFLNTQWIEVGEKSIVKNVTFSEADAIQIGKNSKIENVYFSRQNFIKVGNSTLVEDSDLRCHESKCNVHVGNESILENVVYYSRSSRQETFTPEGQLNVSNNSTLASVDVYGQLIVHSYAKVKDAKLDGWFEFKDNSSLLSSNLKHKKNFILLENGSVENFIMDLFYYNHYDLHGEDFKIQNLKDGVLDDMSVKFNPSSRRVKAIKESWIRNDRHQLNYDNTSKQRAQLIASNFKTYEYVQRNQGELSPLIVNASSNVSYELKKWLSDDYVFNFKKSTTYNIELNPALIPTENRTNAYTLYEGKIVPSYKGYKKDFKITLRSFDERIDFRYPIIKKKMEDLGFRAEKVEYDTGITYSLPIE